LRKNIVTSLFLIILFGVVPDVHALDMEFYTYGGFDAVSTAFRKLALIFSDNDYKALFFSVIVLGILFGGAAAYFNLLRGAKGGVLAWVWLIGIVF
jgi:conjugal transfer mating pair stabilization protein TraG